MRAVVIDQAAYQQGSLVCRGLLSRQDPKMLVK